MDSVDAPDQGLDLSNETDDDLLVYMSMREDAPSKADEALVELFRRHRKYLYNVCCRSYSDILDGSAIADLVTDTFMRASQKAGTFKRSGLTDARSQRAYVRAWLSKIAERLVMSALRSQRGVIIEHLDDEQWEAVPEQEAGDAEAEGPSPETQFYCEAFERLTEREQHVLRVTALWHKPGQEHQKLPDDVSEELAESLGTTSDNIRQIRHRARRKIKDYVQSKLDAK
jgi:RNA polymerase sigma factor (sigma-70 family)